jgi:glycosyltransferase involved in cell wall biosynthesis
MKIAVWHNLPSGGGSRALRQHIKGLAERGHELTVWTSSLADSQFLDVDQYAGPPRVLPLDMNLRIRHHYRDKLRAMAFSSDTQMDRMLDFCRRCADEINAGGFDVLFANACHQFLMPYIGRFVNGPKVLYLGEPNRALYEARPPLIWEALPSAESRWRQKAYRKQFWDDIFSIRQARVRVREERANYHSYDTVLVNSRFSNESLLRAYGQPGAVCYLGVDAELFPFLDLPREPFVLGLGAFFPHKRPDTAIEALARIPADRRPPLIWIGNIGNPAYVASIQQLADRLGVRLETRQNVAQAELVRLLNTASCMLYTSALEPFGLAPLEANACGLPVVAVAEGGIRETIVDGQNGLLRDRDPAALGLAVDQILTDPALFARLSANARQVVQEQWTVVRAIDRLEQALLAAVSTRSVLP